MAPKINDLKGPILKDLGQSVVLECTASGTPPVDVVWKREGKSDERQQVWTVLCFCFKALHPRVVGASILQSLCVCPSFLPSLCFNNLSRIDWFYMMQVNVITWASVFFFWLSFLSSYYITVLYTQYGQCLPGLFVKRHQARESHSCVHRSSVD